LAFAFETAEWFLQTTGVRGKLATTPLAGRCAGARRPRQERWRALSCMRDWALLTTRTLGISIAQSVPSHRTTLYDGAVFAAVTHWCFQHKPSPSIISPVRALRCSMHAMQEAARRLVSATAVLILPSTNQNARLAAKDCAIAITKAKATPFVCCEGFSAFRSWVSLGLHPFLLLKVVTAGRFPQSGQLQSTRRM